jgi:hypothetical protein
LHGHALLIDFLLIYFIIFEIRSIVFLKLSDFLLKKCQKLIQVRLSSSVAKGRAEI